MITAPLPYALLAPSRPRLHEALAAVGHTRSPLLAWERLATAGLIPFEQLDEPTRRFRIGRWQQRRRPEEICARWLLAELDGDHMWTGQPFRPAPRLVSTRPITARAAAVFASDFVVVREVEALAREACLRLRPWRPAATWSPEISVVWGVRPSRWSPLATVGSEQLRLLRSQSLTGVIPDAFRPLGGVFAQGTAPRSLVQTIAACSEAWEAAARGGLRIGEGLRWAPPKNYGASLWGRGFRSVANPFAPLVEIYKRGYAVRAITADVVSLIMAL